MKRNNLKKARLELEESQGDRDEKSLNGLSVNIKNTKSIPKFKNLPTNETLYQTQRTFMRENSIDKIITKNQSLLSRFNVQKTNGPTT